MADVNKPKLQLRSGLPMNGDKTPSPATKLLINHGKPNFTIPRPPKAQNGKVNTSSPTLASTYNVQNNNNNNNELVVKSTTFNGVFKPSNIGVAAKKILPQNGNVMTNDGNDNEASKVVLRRANVAHTDTRECADDDNVPEFIRRQRRIQERLANQNILDFENRRSGYFTQVLISPTSPNRQSFAETMASPAVRPGLEIPPPPTQQEDIKEETTVEEQQRKEETSSEEQQQETTSEQQEATEVEKSNKSITLNGQVEEEEVAKAIEEVNKAVEGEDDDRTELDELTKTTDLETENADLEHNVVGEETKIKDGGNQQEEAASLENTSDTKTSVAAPVVISLTEPENHNVNVSVPIVESPKYNDHTEDENFTNGHLKADALVNGITISHVNGSNGPSIPAPDPKGEKGVNFEIKTVVSFSQELGNDDNKYPDKVKIEKNVETLETDHKLNELKNLKFEINENNQDIEVKPVLITETV